MNLGKKVALITGGGSGIGAATAHVLASQGAFPVLLGPDPEPLQKVAAETGGLAVAGDAADPVSVRDAIAKAQQRFGGLDILVTCAGGGGRGTLGETDAVAWIAGLRLNLDTASVTARECLPHLIKAGGSIVIVSSVAGLEAPPSAVGYVTAKHALIGLMRSLACDYGPVGLRVNAVCPGFTRTAVADQVMDERAAFEGTTRDEAYTRTTAKSPLRRPLEPLEIGRLIAFLASDWASGMTGAVVVADGGFSAVSVI